MLFRFSGISKLYYMNKTFTKNDIIRFIYGEMEGEEAILFEQTLSTNDDLNSTYCALKNTSDLIVNFSAPNHVSDFTLLKLRSFARAYTSAPSKFIDRIDLILN